MSVVIPAPAKLTLSLRIIGRRADGYHLLDAEMITLALADTLTIDESDVDTASSVTVDGRYAAGVPVDDGNIVVAALVAAGRHAAVHVHKAIPHGGGLGGGSADAAAVLRWAGVDDVETALALGADVPFCVAGGRARVTGVGETIQPLEPHPFDVTLVIPPIAVSTPAAYRAWDDLGGPHADGGNDLEPAALVVAPELSVWRDRIIDATGVRPALAGSGSTWFLLGHHYELAAALPGATVLLTGAATHNDRP